MSRAAFNTTCDLWRGTPYPYSPPSVVLRGNVPCRVVPQNEITQDYWPNSDEFAWLTYELPEALFPPQIRPMDLDEYTNYYGAPLVSIPSGTLPQWYLVRAELVDPAIRPAYARGLLVPLPPPRIPAAPAASCVASNDMPWQTDHVYAWNPGDSAWFRRTIGIQTFFTLFVETTAGTVDVDVWQGGNCGIAVYLGTATFGPATYLDLSAFPADNYFFNFYNFTAPMTANFVVGPMQ